MISYRVDFTDKVVYIKDGERQVVTMEEAIEKAKAEGGVIIPPMGKEKRHDMQ